MYQSNDCSKTKNTDVLRPKKQNKKQTEKVCVVELTTESVVDLITMLLFFFIAFLLRYRGVVKFIISLLLKYVLVACKHVHACMYVSLGGAILFKLLQLT